jgi:hypothetical protein
MCDLDIPGIAFNKGDRVSKFFDQITLVGNGFAEIAEIESPLQYFNAKGLRRQSPAEFFTIKRIRDLFAADGFIVSTTRATRQAAPVSFAFSTVASISSGETNGLAPSCTATTSVAGRNGTQSVPNGLGTRRSAAHDSKQLRNRKAVFYFFEGFDPFFGKNENYGVDRSSRLKSFKRVNDQWLSVDLNKLFRFI